MTKIIQLGWFPPAWTIWTTNYSNPYKQKTEVHQPVHMMQHKAINMLWCTSLKSFKGMENMAGTAGAGIQQTCDTAYAVELRERNRDCDFESMQCCRCICSNCCSQDAKSIPLCVFCASWSPSQSSICLSLDISREECELRGPGDVCLNCLPLKVHEGTVFSRVRNILNAALCWKTMKQMCNKRCRVTVWIWDLTN